MIFDSIGAKDEVPATLAGFHDELHHYRQQQMARPTVDVTASNGETSKPGVLMAAANAPGGAMAAQDKKGDGGGGGGGSSFFNDVGYITLAGLAFGAFGRDDPLQIQSRATRFFQEKFLHHHAIDNPQVWQAMGDLMMTERHLASEGAKHKPIKLKTLNNAVKHQSKEQRQQRKDFEHDVQDADQILKDIASGLRGPDDYVLAAKSLYMEAITKADARAQAEARDHKDEMRLAGRLKLLSGETDRTSAIETADNSIGPIEDALGARVAYRLDTAAFLERYGSHVPELGWSELASQLRRDAHKIYDDPQALSEPCRRRLHQRYPDDLQDSPLH